MTEGLKKGRGWSLREVANFGKKKKEREADFGKRKNERKEKKKGERRGKGRNRGKLREIPRGSKAIKPTT